MADVKTGLVDRIALAIDKARGRNRPEQARLIANAALEASHHAETVEVLSRARTYVRLYAQLRAETGTQLQATLVELLDRIDEMLAKIGGDA